MALADITKVAVERAIAEYDELGREQFLQKYGFSDAKRYWLTVNQKRYPSKAIAGVAHKYLAGEQPLASSRFTGGESTVVKKLTQLGFTVGSGGRNPDWVRDEVILALDLYLRNPTSPPGKESADVKELSALLNKMHRLSGSSGTPTLRNANGVYLKMMNLRALDATFTRLGRVGMASYSVIDAEVWTEFQARRAELVLEAARIRDAVGSADEKIVAKLPESDPYEGEEGGIIVRLHKRYERDPKLVQRKKAEAISRGALTCEVCGFDFNRAFGELGSGYMEVHHVNALGQVRKRGKTRLSDLALLCSNCHRMAHRRRIPLSLQEIKQARYGLKVT